MTADNSYAFRIRLLWAGFAFVYLACAVLLRDVKPIPDELIHYGQINLFDHGDFRIGYKFLTMLPGYHVVSAAILWILDQRSIEAARFLNALYGVGTCGAFYLLRKRIWPIDAGLMTLQFALLPILFPYDFLVFTDVLSLGLVLAAAAATMRERHVIAGLLMIAAMGVRQNNVVWLPLLGVLTIWPERIGPLPPLRWMLPRLWPYGVGAVLFVAYWIWNGHISLSTEQATMHPDWSVHIGNIYFALFLCALLLPLHVVSGLRGFAAAVRRAPWLAAFPLGALALFFWQFRVDHPYNQVVQPLLLHNYLIQACQAHPVFQALFGMLAVGAACGLASTQLRPQSAMLLYPLSAMALAAAWMIEHRYALIPFALWLALRQAADRRIEYATLALWTVFAVCLCLGLNSGAFHL